MNLQPLQVCMSYQRTNDIVKSISEDHDIEVQFWKDELLKTMESNFSRVNTVYLEV